MFVLDLTLFFAFSLSACRIVAATNGNIAALYNVTDHVLNLTVHDYRAEFLRKRQLPLPAGQEDLINIKNRLHLANVLVGDNLFALAIDTNSSATWITSSSFVCLDRHHIPRQQSTCNLGPTFEPTSLKTLRPLNAKSTFRRDDGMFVEGKYVEGQISIGGVSRAHPHFANLHHTIAIADQGRWNGHGIASGVLGLGFETEEDPFSAIQQVFKYGDALPIFSLALNRAHSDITAGGVLAFGGVPNNILTEGPWAETRILPRSLETPEGYRITIDGFDITPPTIHGFDITPPFDVHTPNDTPVGPFTMAVDSSTPTIIVPPTVAAHTARLFMPPGNPPYPPYNKYSMPCDALAPRVGIIISGRPYYISPADLLSPAPELGDNVCVLELEPASKGRLVLGDVWLRNVLAVFDFTDRAQRRRPEYAYGVLRIAARQAY